MIKLSIIIPAYNAATYLPTCLESCCRQDLPPAEYEVVVVNDGSTDDTPGLVEAMAGEYPNIRLVTQQNKGNGAARNTGVEQAHGSHILFLDADDYLAHNTLGTLMALVEKHKLDILGFDSRNVTDSDQVTPVNAGAVPKDVRVMSGIDFLGTYNYKAEVWWYITNRNFYLSSGQRFYDRKFVQDSYLTPTLFSKAGRTAYLDLDVHRYRQSQNSITRKKSATHLNQHFEDLSFSIAQLYRLRHRLMDEGVNNQDALRRLHVKQQRYVLIVIVRFIRSSLPTDYLRKMLAEYRSLEAYPMHRILSNVDYRNMTFIMLTFVFNRTYLLFPLIGIYRKIRSPFKKLKG